MIGRMREQISIKSRVIVIDAEGFQTEVLTEVLSTRAEWESQHATTVWKNRASFTDATDCFYIRKPAVEIKDDMVIECGAETFEITSVDEIKGRGLWLEILARRSVPSGTD